MLENQNQKRMTYDHCKLKNNQLIWDLDNIKPQSAVKSPELNQDSKLIWQAFELKPTSKKANQAKTLAVNIEVTLKRTAPFEPMNFPPNPVKIEEISGKKMILKYILALLKRTTLKELLGFEPKIQPKIEWHFSKMLP